MKGLRIGWAAPWHDHALITQSDAEVVLELSQCGHSVTVLRTEVGHALQEPPRAAPGPVSALADMPAGDLRQNFDVLVGHFGGDFLLHGALLPRLGEVDVVGIFYESCLGVPARDWLLADEVDRAGLPSGTDGEAHEPCCRGGSVRRGQLLECLARRTVGAVAHAEHYARRLRDACPGPVAVMPIAFAMADLPPPPVPWSGMTIGVIGPVSTGDRTDQLFLAIGASPMLRRCCRIKVIGKARREERERLSWLGKTVRIAPPTFTGRVSIEELRWQVRDVDVFFCPAKAIRTCGSVMLAFAQSSGRSVLVTMDDHPGGNRTDALLVCSPEHVARDTMRHLERLFRHPSRGSRTSEGARVSALFQHTPAAYAKTLLPLLEEVVARQPERVARRHLASTLIGYGLTPDDPAVRRVEAILAGLITGIREST